MVLEKGSKMHTTTKRCESTDREHGRGRGGFSPARRHFRLGKLALACGCLTVVSVLAGCEKKEEKPAMTPPEVMVSEVAQQNVPIYEEWVSVLTGPVNADITPKVQGYLLKQDYQNGLAVKLSLIHI